MTEGAITRRQLKQHFRRIGLKPGDVLMVKAGTGEANVETLSFIVRSIEEIGLKDIVLIAVDGLDDLQVLDEAMMNKYGWYRKENHV